jgi:hypothetical protein
MNIIEELWYGNISPCERDIKKDSEYAELLEQIVRHEEKLQKQLNGEEKEILEKFEAACSDIGTVDKKPVLDGRFMSMVISPVKAK